LQNIKVLDDHDSLGSGEWRLWLFPGIGWTVPGGDARNTLEDVDSGQTVPLNLTYEFVVGLSGFSIRTSGWESDLYDDIFRTGSPVFPRNAFEQGIFQDPLEQNDGIGRVSQHFVGLPSSAGTYDTPSSNKDFRLRYKVEVVQDYPVGTPLR
jgi:hypothetical protein